MNRVLLHVPGEQGNQSSLAEAEHKSAVFSTVSIRCLLLCQNVKRLFPSLLLGLVRFYRIYLLYP